MRRNSEIIGEGRRVSNDGVERSLGQLSRGDKKLVKEEQRPIF
ncbi:MAG: hypothetical protein DDT39_00006 [Firmicutes bacterium]|nr:hypothetical protein [candidate division NPL-UPA2 bacterium]